MYPDQNQYSSATDKMIANIENPQNYSPANPHSDAAILRDIMGDQKKKTHHKKK